MGDTVGEVNSYYLNKTEKYCHIDRTVEWYEVLLRVYILSSSFIQSSWHLIFNCGKYLKYLIPLAFLEISFVALII